VPILKNLRLAMRDATDVLRRANSVGELAKAAIPALQKPLVMNAEPPPHGSAEGGADELARALRALMHALDGEAIVDGRVDYSGLRDSPTFDQLRATSALLHHLRPEHLVTRAEQLAFWTNLYNVLAIHGVISLGIRKSAMEIPSFFATVSYRVGETTLSLDDIENGVLRVNAANPSTRKPQLGTSPSDPRKAWMLDKVDPRIHAALVCTANACPPVAFYRAEAIDDQLERAARGYVAQEVTIDESSRVVEVPITLHYYRADFGGGDAGLRRFVLDHSEGSQRASLENAFAQGFHFRFRKYDWGLNQVGPG